jgi:hypothetical protein
MKRVLIISPNFPPVNSADMHRIRQSLPYFKELGWEPVVITVDEAYIEAYSLDPILMHTIPAEIEVHKVKAFNVNITRKIGLGSLSIRSYYHFQKAGDRLLKERKFDLVYFSTTAFHVMALGPRWKRKFGVPFILDIQDPWRSDFYLDKPKHERPPKFFISYNIDKYLEGKTVPFANGIISVSQGYCDTFLKRYPVLKPHQFQVIPFGASSYDFEVMAENVKEVDRIRLSNDKINVVYVGRGGHDLQFAINIIFGAFSKGLQQEPELFCRVRLWFIGTSYAPAGTGSQTIKPVAEKWGIGEFVTEITDRMPYFDTLFLLKKADALLVPGSTDMSYTASKIYPYILAKKPLLGVFYEQSSVVNVIRETNAGTIIAFNHLKHTPDHYEELCLTSFRKTLTGAQINTFNEIAFEPYLAKEKTKEQVAFFNKIISG